MTTNQWKMLELLEEWGGHGSCEIELQWGEYAPNTDKEDDYSGWRTTRLVVAALIKSLVRKGYATDDGTPEITELGKYHLAMRKAKSPEERLGIWKKYHDR